MMAQPAGATGATPIAATALGAAPADASKSADTDLPCIPAATDAAPFTLALLALAAAPDSGGVVPPAASPADPKAAGIAAADATAPFSLALPVLASTTAYPTAAGAAAAVGTGLAPRDAASPQPATPARSSAAPVEVSASSRQPASSNVLPQDLLRALFAPGAIRPEPVGAGRTGAAGDARNSPAAPATRTSGKDKAKSGQDTSQASTAMAASPPDPGAALLATVLQWLQQQRDATHEAAAAADAPGGDREPGSPGMSAPIAASTTAAPGIDAAAATQSGGRTHGARTDVQFAVGAQGVAPAGDALPGVALSDALAARRDPAARAAPDEHQHPLPAAASDSTTPGAGAPAGAIAAAAGMDMAAALRAAGAATAAPAERSVAVPVHERHWPTALATQVLVLSNDKVQAATLRLTPEHLGPVEVRIDLRDAQVNVNFTAAHAETRAALEQAMPQLRAVLEGAGLTLGQATVQQQARRESQNSGATARPAGAANEQPEVVAAVTHALGIIDEFA
jgi:flagellar hook-length control protein FliK